MPNWVAEQRNTSTPSTATAHATSVHQQKSAVQLPSSSQAAHAQSEGKFTIPDARTDAPTPPMAPQSGAPPALVFLCCLCICRALVVHPHSLVGTETAEAGLTQVSEVSRGACRSP